MSTFKQNAIKLLEIELRSDSKRKKLLQIIAKQCEEEAIDQVADFLDLDDNQREGLKLYAQLAFAKAVEEIIDE